MATTVKKVVLAGATGNLGPSVLNALVSAGFEVTVLSRKDTIADLPAGAKVVKVDYASQASVTEAIKGHDAFVSNIPNHDEQAPLIDACIAAGVKRFIPSEFGSNVSGNAKVAALPVFAGKAATQEYLKKVGGKIDWTLIVTGGFLDWGMQYGFVIDDLKGARTRIYGDGNHVSSWTLLSDVGKAVVGVLRHLDETRNRTVFVQSAALSQNRVLELARKRKPSLETEIVHVDLRQLERESYEKLKAGGPGVRDAMFGFLWISVFDPEYGNYWGEKTENELFGIKELTNGELEDLVGQYV